MAVVMEFVASNGAHVTVLDDAYAGVSKEEMAKRWERVEEIGRRMAINNEIRRIKLEREAQAAAEKTEK